jgi:hypothetical protein
MTVAVDSVKGVENCAFSTPKHCPRCRATKAESEFHWRSRPQNIRQSYCAECACAATTEWNSRNKERIAESNRQRRLANPTEERDRRLKRDYGLAPREYDRILESQNGLCAICQGEQQQPKSGKRVMRMSVDHCHSTGLVRSLLCGKCNAGLGAFCESPEIMEIAMDYLAFWRMAHAIKLNSEGDE